MFFDSLRLKYSYEPEGFELADGTKYLPDFWLEDLKCYFEVKGAEPTEAEKEKARLLCQGTMSPVILAHGDIEVGQYAQFMLAYNYEFTSSGGGLAGQNKALWCVCGKCGKPSIYIYGDGYFYGEGETFVAGPNWELWHPCLFDPKTMDPQHPDLLRATRAARSARFDHGQKGAIDPSRLSNPYRRGAQP